MNVSLAVFVKTPGYSPIKTRLAADIGSTGALTLYRLCVAAVTQSADQACQLNADLHRYWAVAESSALEHWASPPWSTLDQGEGDLGTRLWTIQQQLLARHQALIFIGADCPQVSAAELSAAVTALAHHDAVIGPADDGGFWLWGSRHPLSRQLWGEVPWSSSETLTALRSRLPTNWKMAELASHTDLDCAADIESVTGELQALNAPNQAQQRVSSELAKARRGTR